MPWWCGPRPGSRPPSTSSTSGTTSASRASASAGCTTLSEDAAQETFARGLADLPYFAGERRFYPWLTVIASNLCADMLRARGRTTPSAEVDLRGLVSDERTGEEVAIANVDADLADAAFQRLSDRQRACSTSAKTPAGPTSPSPPTRGSA